MRGRGLKNRYLVGFYSRTLVLMTNYQFYVLLKVAPSTTTPSIFLLPDHRRNPQPPNSQQPAQLLVRARLDLGTQYQL